MTSSVKISWSRRSDNSSAPHVRSQSCSNGFRRSAPELVKMRRPVAGHACQPMHQVRFSAIMSSRSTCVSERRCFSSVAILFLEMFCCIHGEHAIGNQHRAERRLQLIRLGGILRRRVEFDALLDLQEGHRCSASAHLRPPAQSFQRRLLMRMFAAQWPDTTLVSGSCTRFLDEPVQTRGGKCRGRVEASAASVRAVRFQSAGPFEISARGRFSDRAAQRQ